MAQQDALSVEGITKQFGGVLALDDVSAKFRKGEVLALLGDNGAGKSTLIKVISGTCQPDDGTIHIDGEQANFANPRDAMDAGIRTVFQDLALCDNLDVVSILFLGDEIRSSIFPGASWFNDRKMRDETIALLDGLAVDLPSVDAKVRDLSGGQRQSVPIARAIRNDSQIIIMDEPTAALGVAQTRKVLDLVLRMKEKGLAVIYVTHNMHDAKEVSGRCLVMNNGRMIGGVETAELTKDELASIFITGDLNAYSDEAGQGS